MPEQSILSQRAGAVLTLTLNRPDNLNSFNAGMHAELMAVLNRAADESAVRALVITGKGRGFCAGQDLADPAVAPPGTGAPAKDLGVVVEQTWAPLVKRLRSMPVPTVAAVNGVAAGAGANLALSCDMVFAGRGASFIQAFSKIALIPDTGGTWLLPRLVGRARALGLTLLGDKLSADDAERIGLIWRSVEDSDLMAQAQACAERLASLPTQALVATRWAMDDALLSTADDSLDKEAKLQRKLGFAQDYSEGVAAFREKRPPVFRDR